MNDYKVGYYPSEGRIYEFPEIPEEVQHPRSEKDIGVLIEDDIFALENDNYRI